MNDEEKQRPKLAIVGNGFILQRFPKGQEIDKCDLVARIHPRKGTLRKDITGSKTDFFVCEPTTYERYSANKGKVLMLTPEMLDPEKIVVFQKQFGFLPDYVSFPFDLEREYRIMAKARPAECMCPTTGAKAIVYFLNRFKSYDIYLYGFDFYRFTPNKYFYEKQQGEWVTNPSIEKRYKIEKDYIINLTKKHNNLYFVEK